MTDWFVGRRAVAIADRAFWLRGGFVHRAILRLFNVHVPIKGVVYEVSAVEHGPNGVFLALRGYGNLISYNACGFRPLVESENDISIFARILDRVNKHEVTDA